jgi:prepilin-type processing-associated H-X9-DG protein
MGRNYGNAWDKKGKVANPVDGWSHLARLLNYAEQTAIYNAINFADCPYSAINSTAESAGLSLLWCPSDPTIAGLRFFEADAGWDGTTVGITYSSYGAMIGTYIPNDGKNPNTTELQLENGMYPDVGIPTWAGGTGVTRQPVKYASITDGTSNTIAWAEMGHGIYSQFGISASGCCDWTGFGWWADADYGDSTISSFYPPNMPLPPSYYNAGVFQNADGCDTSNIPTISSNSYHPGGVNVGFADGSVHFIKSSINSWRSLNIARSNIGGANCMVPAGTIPGVWQALSTINGGEVVSADQY